MPLFMPHPQRLLLPPIWLPELQLEIVIVRSTNNKKNMILDFSIEIDDQFTVFCIEKTDFFAGVQ